MSDDAEYDSLAELVFEKDDLSAVDFEIALTATLATIVLATLGTGRVDSDLMKVVAILLLLLTLMRRMVVTSRYRKEDWFLKISLIPLELLIILVFFHSFYALSEVVSTVLNLTTSTLFLTAVLIPETIIFLIVLQEILFGNYMIWWGSYSMALAVKTDNQFNRVIGGATSMLALWVSMEDELPEELDEVQEIFETVKTRIDEELEQLNIQSNSEDVFRVWNNLLLILLPVALGVLYTVGAFLLSFVLGSPTEVLLLLFAIFCIRHLTRFYYLAHGLPNENQMYRGVGYKTATYVVYVSITLALFG